MNFNKSAYLAVNEVKARLNKAELNTLVFNEQANSNGLIYLEVTTAKGLLNTDICKENNSAAIVYLDECMIDSCKSMRFNTVLNVSTGVHRILIKCAEPYCNVLITLNGVAIKRTDTYELFGYDEAQSRVIVKSNRDKLYSIYINSDHPSLEADLSYSAYSGINYTVNGTVLFATAYIDDNRLYLNDNGVVSEISSNASGVAMMKAQLSDYYYNLYYIEQGCIKLIIRDINGLSAPQGIGNDIVDRIVGLGERVMLIRTNEGVWHSIEEGVNNNILTINRVEMNAGYIPSFRINSNDIKYYLRINNKYCNAEFPNKAITTSDGLAFIGDKAIALWNGRAEIMTREDYND